MAQSKKNARRDIAHYAHADRERLNNPPVGLVTPDTDRDVRKNTYTYDPHLDPQLAWAGKAENTSFEVPTISLHVHERIDPRTIIEATKRPNGSGTQLSLFASPRENPPLRQAIEFYKHKHGWSNRLIAGDSLLVMNSLLEKEGMAGQVQMVYIDPPYGITYGSNFQPFVNDRDVKDGKDEDLTSEPETLKAFRDTWELGIHSYLAYMRDRLLLTRELLSNSGSVFVQISDENMHHVREILDEVFGPKNFIAIITVKKTGGLVQNFMPMVADYLFWYARDHSSLKWHQLFANKPLGAGTDYQHVELPNGTRRRLTSEEAKDLSLLPKDARVFQTTSLESENPTFDFIYNSKTYRQRWKTNLSGLTNLAQASRLWEASQKLRYVLTGCKF